MAGDGRSNGGHRGEASEMPDFLCILPKGFKKIFSAFALLDITFSRESESKKRKIRERPKIGEIRGLCSVFVPARSFYDVCAGGREL